MRSDTFSRDDWIVGGLALLLAVTLLFLPWFSIPVGPFALTTTATGSFDGWTAIIAVLASLAVLGDLLTERLSPGTALPNFGGSRTATRFRLALVAAGFVALKFLLHVHFGWFDIGFWIAVVATVALVVVTQRLSQDRPILGVSS